MELSPATNLVDVTPLGQAGFRLGFGALAIYIDPYLSNSVEASEGPDLRRQVPIWKDPDTIDDADWVFVTHTHIDHCDVDTLVPMSRASKQCRVLGPQVVGDILAAHGMDSTRFVRASDDWLSLGEDLRVHPVPAAHPEIESDPRGGWRHVGFVIDFRGKRIYHSGDTLLNAAIIEAAFAFRPIDVAILPVNERNHYREARGIIGNMSVREAFRFAADLQVSTLVPMHWDMFAPNSIYPEEIETFTRLAQPPFRVLLKPTQI